MSTANVFEDLSGISTSSFSNPYQALISACNDDPVCRHHLLSEQTLTGNRYSHRSRPSMLSIEQQGTPSRRPRCWAWTLRASTLTLSCSDWAIRQSSQATWTQDIVLFSGVDLPLRLRTSSTEFSKNCWLLRPVMLSTTSSLQVTNLEQICGLCLGIVSTLPLWKSLILRRQKKSRTWSSRCVKKPPRLPTTPSSIA